MSSIAPLSTANILANPVAHSAFRHLRTQAIESLKLTIEEYEHLGTGARHYHLAADTKENVFLVALRTVPTDSTGVAHILEHTVLCGSERYPVRDPFFMMIRRSLNTFMNAFTSSDWTAYPFASENQKDFYNLLDVYLDAVFFANLNELDFAQEGHRIEFADTTNANSDLVFKGVVFNEMKGAMSSPVSTLWQTLTKYLYPTTTYHYNSGGEPEDIPDLTYEQLKSFYRTHYHPSNAVFMTYGSLPVAELQQKFHEQALSRFQQAPASIRVKNEKRYLAPVTIEESYAVDSPEECTDKTHIVIGWLLGPTTDLLTSLKAELLSGILLDDSASPLRHALETTSLGTAPSPLCGLENSHREMAFICGIEGSSAENAQAVETLVLETLHDVAAKGIAKDRVIAVLHQLELEQREIGGNHYPYGLQLILEMLPAAVHDSDPLRVLDLDPVLEQLHREIEDAAFVPNLIRDLLINNSHRVRLTLKPDAELATRRDIAEKMRLDNLKQALNESEKQRIIGLTKLLAERQAQVDDINILPKVGLTDVPDALHIASGDTMQINKYPSHLFTAGTNGIIYQQVIADLPALTESQLDVLPYYTNVITEVGCGEQDYLALQQRQSSVSGGISAFTTVRSAIDDVSRTNGHFVLSGKALSRNHRDFSQLMHEIFHDARFDEHSRIRELMAQLRASREQSITGNGHVLAMRAASAGMSPAAALKHRLFGLHGINALKQLDDTLDDQTSIKNFCDELSKLHDLVRQKSCQLLLIGEADNLQLMKDDINNLWLPSIQRSTPPLEFSNAQQNVAEIWITNTSVNFCSMAYPCVPVSHPDAPALSVLGGFLKNGFLHRTIREQGGAYGGGASYDSDAGCFNFYSYRDPRILDTLQDFRDSVTWLLNTGHEQQPLEEAILGVISSMDKPSSPSGEAKEAFHNALYGRTPAQRQEYRRRILGVNLEDLKRVGEKYLTLHTPSIAIISSHQHQNVADKLGLTLRKI